MKKRFAILVTVILTGTTIRAQEILQAFRFGTDSLELTAAVTSGRHYDLRAPLLSLEVDTRQLPAGTAVNSGAIALRWTALKQAGDHVKGTLQVTNTSNDTINLRNLVPFGAGADKVYITGSGTHSLSRTHLFLPGKMPVNVIVPDNAWDLGYASLEIDSGLNLVALLRRNRASVVKGTRTRFETNLLPGGTVQYDFYAETVRGNWQAALRRTFQERKLFDLEVFDNALFEREDLKWIRHSYVMHLMMAWDKFFYDSGYKIRDFVARGKQLYGGDDIITIWPTWPTLGLDQRNQFDLYRDLPGGTVAVRDMAQHLQRDGVKLFISYNPWDESTRREDHFEGITNLLVETAANGVVLDTKGESSKELQAAADKAGAGIIMYSEGMAVPRDMPGIPSGRVHNALYYAPMLNLNKLIQPNFAIFRVAELAKEKIRREFATSFFNGYGVEINIMQPGQPAWVEEQYAFLGRTTRILRENSPNFTQEGWTPLVPTTSDSIWVNQWPLGEKTIYTIYSIRSEGYRGALFEVSPGEGFHYVDLWHHRLVTPENRGGKWYIPAQTDPFSRFDLGTNNEGAVDCIARLPVLIHAKRKGDELLLQSPQRGSEWRIWAGAPAYDKKPLLLKPGSQEIRLHQHFGGYEGDLVIQLMDNGILLDEQVVHIPAGEARRVSITEKTVPATVLPDQMVQVPAGTFRFTATNSEGIIPYPVQDTGEVINVPAFYMDRYPVTNRDFKRFLDATGYRPADTVNFLRHWINGKIPQGEEKFPVVQVSYEDARAYASWAGKRLPTEIEWQYAAQTPALNEWPWPQKDGAASTSRCNMGDGKPYPVGKYRKGVNPYGLYDLVGSVWQLTNDEYRSGSYRYIILKGGSYFKPTSSWWYVQGGPRPLHYRQQLLRVSPGFERNATIGFRCVRDSR